MTMEHLARSFAISLHVSHPTMDPADVTHALQLSPKRTREAGPPRKPPFDRAHWSYKFDCKDVRDLVPFLEEIAAELRPRREFFRHLVESDGQIELFCGVNSQFNWDEVLPTSLMAQLADLGIDLRLDVYPAGTQRL